MKLQDYLKMNAKFTRMEQLVNKHTIEYALEKLVPLVEHGFEYDDIADFLVTRFNNFVYSGKLDELLEQNKDKIKNK